MAKTLSSYNPAVSLAAGITPAGHNDPLVEVHDILVDNNGTRLDAKLASITESIGGTGSSSVVAQLATKVDKGSITTEIPASNNTDAQVPSTKSMYRALASKVNTVGGSSLMTDAEHTKLAGIANGATNVSVDSSLSTSSVNPVQNKVVKSALDTMSSKVTALQNGMLVASTKAAMTDTKAYYIYTGSESGMTKGNWYYHNGSAWVSGGAVGDVVVDADLIKSGAAADAKVVGDQLADLSNEIGIMSGKTITVNTIGGTKNGGQGTIVLQLKPNTIYTIEPVETSWDLDPSTTDGTSVFVVGYTTLESKVTTDVIKVYKSNMPLAASYTYMTPASNAASWLMTRSAVGTSVYFNITEVPEILKENQRNYHPYNDICQFSVNTNLTLDNAIYWGEGVSGSSKTPIINAKQLYSCSSAIADIRPITYEDSSPIIENNKIWYSVTCGIRIGGTGCTIIEVDLGTSEIKLTGHILALYPDGTYFGATGNAIIFDRINGKWILLTHSLPSAADENIRHLNLISLSYSDPRFGVSHIKYSVLDYENKLLGDEDAYIFYDTDMKKWVLIYAGLESASSYTVVLQTSNRPDGGFTFYKRKSGVSATGITTTKIGGVRYVLTGNNRSNNSNQYTALSYPDLNFVCNLNIDIEDGGSRGWNNLTPIPEGDGTKYILFTFDRAVTSPRHIWTYGNNYMYCSAEKNIGLEFPIKNGNVTIPSNIQALYDISQLHLCRQWSKREAFSKETILSEIKLNSDVYLSDSNLYPVTGTALKQSLDGLYLTKTGDAFINAGTHKPYSSYKLSKCNIADNDVRYICLFDLNGNTIEKIGINSLYQVVRYVSGNWNVIGTIPTYVNNILICTASNEIFVMVG